MRNVFLISILRADRSGRCVSAPAHHTGTVKFFDRPNAEIAEVIHATDAAYRLTPNAEAFLQLTHTPSRLASASTRAHVSGVLVRRGPTPTHRPPRRPSRPAEGVRKSDRRRWPASPLAGEKRPAKARHRPWHIRGTVRRTMAKGPTPPHLHQRGPCPRSLLSGPGQSRSKRGANVYVPPTASDLARSLSERGVAQRRLHRLAKPARRHSLGPHDPPGPCPGDAGHVQVLVRLVGIPSTGTPAARACWVVGLPPLHTTRREAEEAATPGR